MGGISSIPPGGNGGYSQDYTSILQRIEELLKEIIKPGLSIQNIDVVSLAAPATVQRLFVDLKQVRAAIIQNISTEDVTLFTNDAGTASQGIILNAASAAGKGGGSLTVQNVDLYLFWFVRTTAGVTLAVYEEL